MRHTTFRFALAPTPTQAAMLARHAGASRFAYNQCLRLVAQARGTKRTDSQAMVLWSGCDLINALNAWKRGEAAGRVFVAAPDGTITKEVTGLRWRHEVSAQVFEEAAVDLGRALSAYRDASFEARRGRVGFPRWKRKGRCRDSFRLRNKQSKSGAMLIRVGEGHPRSCNRAKAIRRLSRQHARIADVRRHFLHEVSSQLVQTHDRLCLEDLIVANLMTNRRLARAIGDAAWSELARQLTYKSAWFGTELVVCDRWFASTKTCSRCGTVKQQMELAERIFRCADCALVIDRDRNAAVNLAAWAERSHAQAPDRQAGGRVINAPGGEGADHRLGDGATGPSEGGTDAHAFLA